jgi:hypothetical protein
MRAFVWTLMLVSLGLTLGCAQSNAPVPPDHETMQQHMGY